MPLISGYSVFQQEIIFYLLQGQQSDKIIANLIQNKTKKNIEPKSIRDSIQAIFKKLRTFDRNELVLYLNSLGFNKYIPNTLYSSGVYDCL